MTEPASLLATLIGVVEERDPQGGDLDRVATAVSVAAEVGDLADRLVGHYVDRARAGGATWSQIGEGLGVSKQAAQQRSVPTAFERYTNRAKQVVGRAQTAARELGQSSVSPSLLLLAMCQDVDSLAARTLEAHGIGTTELGDALVAVLPERVEHAPDRSPFTVAAKQMLDQAPREALKLGHDYVGTEHLLLATLRQPEGLPAAVVSRFNLAYEVAGATIDRLLEEQARPRRRAARAK
jgi:hypothetical protein